MNTRKTLAAATLAALPLVAGAMGSAPPRPAADTDHARPVAERTSGPRVLYWAGVDPVFASLMGAIHAPYVWGGDILAR